MLTAIDRTAEKFEDVALLVGRLAIAALFLPSGFNKLTDIVGFTQNLTGRGVPGPGLLAWVGAVIEFFGALALAIGFQTRLTALVMIVFTIMATLIGHRYWEMADAARVANRVNFWKNVAIMGGLLAYFTRGAGRFSLDRGK
jgi:putative oxidoreductase